MKNRRQIHPSNAIMISLMIILMAFFQSCKEDSVDPIIFFEIEDEDLNLAFLAGSSANMIDVRSNAEELTLSTDVEWFKAEYDKHRSIIAVTVSDNINLEPRIGTITVTNVNPQVKLKVTQLGIKPTIILESSQVNINYQEQELVIDLLSNIDLNTTASASWINNNDELKSLRIDPVKFSFSYNINALPSKDQRLGKIYFEHQEGQLRDSVLVVQSLTSDEYTPGDIQSFEKDKKLTITGAVLEPSNMFQTGQPIQNSFDGDYESMYHSPWSGINPNTTISLTYQLQNEESVLNYIVLQPRLSGSNGVIKSGSIEVKSASSTDFIHVKDFNFNIGNTPQVINLSTPIVNPEYVRVKVTDAYTGDGTYYVSLAEIECYESRSLSSLENDLSYFTDLSFSQLVPGFTVQDIPNIENAFIKNIAVHLLAGTYPMEYRVQTYEPYRDIYDLKSELKCSSYNQFENPTGIYFEKNENIIVFMEDNKGENVSLRVRDFGPTGDDYSYSLQKGVNILTMKGCGNGYLSYYTDNVESAPNLKVHIAMGQINGFFDASIHSNNDAVTLLDNAVSPILDLKGKHVQLAYTVSALKANSYEHVHDLVDVYDSIVSYQYQLLGLKKYNRIPKNRMFGRTSWTGYMFKDNYGAGFNEDQMSQMAHYEKIKSNIWGPAHEFGHVNQVQPGMMWVGTAEVTNNIFSSYIQWKYAPDNLRLEKENIGGEIGGRFNAYLNNALINNQEWGLQAGPDRTYGEKDGKWGGDLFVSLCPLWQLTVFFDLAGEGNAWHRPDFWGDIFEKVRNTDETGLSHGQLQINFVKNACDAAQLNLSDFFIKAGFLKVVDKFCGDYTSRQKTITKSMIDEVISYAQQYPNPPTDNIYYISGNNYKAFRDQKAVQGNYNYGVGVDGEVRTVSHDTWKNVVVFETYAGDELKYITMVGTGSSSNQSTKVAYPSGATRIEAVGYDGTRLLVYGNR